MTPQITTTYVLRTYYRGSQGEWQLDRTRRFADVTAAIAHQDALDLGHGWKSQLVERHGRTNTSVLRTCPPGR